LKKFFSANKNLIDKENIEQIEKIAIKQNYTLNEIVEICLSDIQSAQQAVLGGANAIELCSNRKEGGITPSIGLVEECVQIFASRNIQINVLIRPRPGDFVYTDSEFQTIQRDIIAVKEAGADGE
jgi:copper homeostasis protein